MQAKHIYRDKLVTLNWNVFIWDLFYAGVYNIDHVKSYESVSLKYFIPRNLRKPKHIIDLYTYSRR